LICGAGVQMVLRTALHPFNPRMTIEETIAWPQGETACRAEALAIARDRWTGSALIPRVCVTTRQRSGSHRRALRPAAADLDEASALDNRSKRRC
jgi:hypothetical protein